MPHRTPYHTLGIPPQSTSDEIKHAYRALVLKWHPDRHEHDKAVATKRFIEINNAYKELTQTLDLESNFEEPAVMNNDAKSQTSSLGRQSSSSSSAYSDDSFYGPRRTHSFDSGFQTTPSSSFKESPTSSFFPKTPFPQVPTGQLPTPASPRYETWSAGSDLPEGSRHHVYPKPQLPRAPRPRPRATSIPKPPPIFTAASPQRDSPSSSAVPRLSHSVVPPQASSSPSSSSHSATADTKRYQNHFGEVVTPVLHTSEPYDLPLVSIGLGQSGEWTYALPLALEELFTGIHLTLPITRHMLSGRSRTVTLELDIPSGCRTGSRLVCRRVGHEIKHGVFQDISFIIEDKLHDRFTRECDDLLLELQIPLVEGLRQYGGEIPFVGVDGQVLAFFIDFPHRQAMKGRSIIKAGGMPARHGGKVIGRGNMIVDWELVLPQPKKGIGFVKRFWRK